MRPVEWRTAPRATVRPAMYHFRPGESFGHPLFVKAERKLTRSARISLGVGVAPNDVSETFSISPAEVMATASTWQQQGVVVNGLDFTGMACASGAGSRTFAAVVACSVAATNATESIGGRLTTLGESLRTFTVTSSENDRTTADSFTRLMPR